MPPTYYIDDSRLRLAWVIPFSLIVWAALLTLFALLLERTAPPPTELAPAEVRIVELPPTAGLQGGAAAKHPAAAPTKPKIETPKPNRHIKTHKAEMPLVRAHPIKPKEHRAPILPPSPSEAEKESNEASASS